MTANGTFADEVRRGERFRFGKNWSRFLNALNDERIAAAEQFLCTMLEVRTLRDVRFLDVGSGSGLYSLAARRLGAIVHSFDYDPESVACTLELRRRYFAGDPNWTVERGSVLDIEYLQALGSYDVVYSWGVLHHTGAMWTALDNVRTCVADRGKLFIAIYNDQGGLSTRWRAVKKLYCSGWVGASLVAGTVIPWWIARRFVIDCLKGDDPRRYYVEYKNRRGMSPRHDWLDWLGGYPFEVARPEQIFRFYRDRGFTLINMTTKGALAGCNELIFVRGNTSALPTAGNGRPAV